MQAIFPYWGFPNWTTEPNAKMVKYLIFKCYTNRANVLKTLVGVEHRMLRDLIFANLCVTVSGTLFSAPTVPVINIIPTATHSQLATHERKHKEKMIVFLNSQNFREALEKSFRPSYRPHIFRRSPNPLSRY